ASSCVHVGPACTWLKSRMRTPSRALPAWPHGFVEGRGRPLTDAAAFFLAASFTSFLADFFAAALLVDLLFLRVVIALPLDESSIDSADYFLRIALCGLRLPMRPLSEPAAGSITALISVGLPESIAWFTARLSSSGVVTWAPTPPNASAIFS